MCKLQTFISNVLIDQLGTEISQFSAFLALIGDRLVSLIYVRLCNMHTVVQANVCICILTGCWNESSSLWVKTQSVRTDLMRHVIFTQTNMDNLKKVTKLPRARSQRIRAVTRKNYGDKKTERGWRFIWWNYKHTGKLFK